jgi:hypothetical protein
VPAANFSNCAAVDFAYDGSRDPIRASSIEGFKRCSFSYGRSVLHASNAVVAMAIALATIIRVNQVH